MTLQCLRELLQANRETFVPYYYTADGYAALGHTAASRFDRLLVRQGWLGAINLPVLSIFSSQVPGHWRLPCMVFLRRLPNISYAGSLAARRTAVAEFLHVWFCELCGLGTSKQPTEEAGTTCR